MDEQIDIDEQILERYHEDEQILERYHGKISKLYEELGPEIQMPLSGSDFFCEILHRVYTEACLENQILQEKINNNMEKIVEKEMKNGRNIIFAIGTAFQELSEEIIGFFPSYLNSGSFVDRKKAFIKFVNDEKQYESTRRGLKGQNFRNDDEAEDATLMALTKRCIDYFKDGTYIRKTENLRCSLEPWFNK